MNFYGHAWLAASERNDVAFVLGAMLPDLATMAGCRVRGAADADLQGGLDHHLAADVAFHAAPLFRQMMREAVAALARAGVRRGTGRAAAHVIPELLLDGWIAQHHGTHEAYELALDHSAEHLGTVDWRCGAAASVSEVCRRIAEAKLPDSYASPEFAASRLTRILARRPRLAVRPSDAAAVRAWVLEAAPLIRERAPALLDQLRDGLAHRSGARGRRR